MSVRCAHPAVGLTGSNVGLYSGPASGPLRPAPTKQPGGDGLRGEDRSGRHDVLGGTYHEGIVL